MLASLKWSFLMKTNKENQIQITIRCKSNEHFEIELRISEWVGEK